jgi:hypothetical protein
MGADVQTGNRFQELVNRADAGDWAACARVGHMYAAGDQLQGIEKNRALALQYYEKGAQAGDLSCMFGLAGALLAENPQRAIEIFEACAQRKHIWSLAALGDFYLRGRHVQQDVNKAFRCLEEYNALCLPEKVGAHTFRVRWDLVLYPICLFRGIGCTKDEKKAMEELSRLARLGNLNAADILQDGRLTDWMAAKRFNIDTRTQGPLVLFDGGAQKKRARGRFSGKPQVNKAQYEVVGRENLSVFLQRSLIPDEKIIMRARFPRIYVVDTYLRMFFLFFLGWWTERFFVMHANAIYETMPYDLYVLLYSHPYWPFFLFGALGVVSFLHRMIRMWTTEIVLTDRRFIYKRGLFSIEMVQMNFWQIEHSDVTQSILGNLLDYGTVHLQSFSVQQQEGGVKRKGMLTLPPLSHPFLLSRLIEDNRQLPFRQNVPGGPIPMWNTGR